MTTETPHFATALRAACAEARKYLGATSPNPAVGAAALDKNGRILAVAAHQRAGTAHAEAALLTLCREQGLLDQIDTLCVTLEPCNHHGRTPPCAEAIINAGIKRVVIGTHDPNPHVAGGGIERLKMAGVEIILAESTVGTPLPSREGLGEGAIRNPTDLDICTPPLLTSPSRGEESVQLSTATNSLQSTNNECKILISSFVYATTQKKSFVTIKRALNYQGSMVPPTGQKTFTSPSSLVLAHRLRKKADAIITGSGTILADNPLFTVRHVPDHPNKKRILAILDRRQRVPDTYLKQVRQNNFEPVIYTDAEQALADLYTRGAQDVLVEAGPALSDHMLDKGLWNISVTIRQGEPDSIDTQFNTATPIPFDTTLFDWNTFLPT